MKDYLEIDQNSYDVVIYATFPDEEAPQFNKIRSVIPQTDEKFLGFKKTRILFDSLSHGSKDGFPRLNDYSIPRLKTAPDKEYLQKFNVILPLTYPIGMYIKSPAYNYLLGLPFSPKTINKTVDISYRVNPGLGDSEGSYRQQIRMKILDKLEPYAKAYSLDTNYQEKDPNYNHYLAKVLISVCPPGHGPGTFRHLETLNAQSLMFSHDSINDIKLLPNAELIEGEDYIAFNLDNITDKLDQLLANPKSIESIAKRGYEKFKRGYSSYRTAMRLYQILRELV
ncbi:glycosyltransferase [Rippkaea orientalis]|uniref:glycosyltransferase n=1 Tax=Rippkaea orientalis TaxID=2546366 RepID=UPI0002DA975A|nr:glycosyltransferase [Rippkaea orientalis]